MGNNLKEIRKKIGSVHNTQKTTRAMKLVSTSKLKKADEMAKRSRQYASKIIEVISEIKARIVNMGIGSKGKYFEQTSEDTNTRTQIIDGTTNVTVDPQVKMVDIILVTADKGLCAGFNINTIKETNRLVAEFKRRNVKVRLRAVGKKAIAYYHFNEIELIDKAVGLSAVPNYELAASFVQKAVSDFLNGVTNRVILVHNGFKNMISQELKVQQLLPIPFTFNSKLEMQTKGGSTLEVEPEIKEEEILNQLATKYIDFSMYYSLLDSLAAEHSARMQAMDAATNNAEELVKSLTVAYNKARQAAITTELVEINTGVESMK